MSLIATRLQDMRDNTTHLDAKDLRASQYGAYECFRTQSNEPNSILSDELKSRAVSSIGREVETPVFDYDGDVTIGNTRELEIPVDENTSRMLRFTFQTYAFGFTMVPAMYLNNEIGQQRDFERKMTKYIYKLAETLDTDCLNILSTRKTQHVKNPLLFNFGSQTIQSTFAQRSHLFRSLPMMMRSNDFYGGLDIVGDIGVEAIAAELAQYGKEQYVNKGSEFNGKRLFITNTMATSSSHYAQGYAIERGTLGMLHRFERECLLGSRSRDGHEWGTDVLPLLDLPVGTYFYDSVGDYRNTAGAATADFDRGIREYYGFAVDLCFVTPWFSQSGNDSREDAPWTPSSGEHYRPTSIISFNVSSDDALMGVPVVNMN